MDSCGTGQVSLGARGVVLDASVFINFGSKEIFTYFLAELLKEVLLCHHSFDGVEHNEQAVWRQLGENLAAVFHFL